MCVCVQKVRDVKLTFRVDVDGGAGEISCKAGSTAGVCPHLDDATYVDVDGPTRTKCRSKRIVFVMLVLMHGAVGLTCCT